MTRLMRESNVDWIGQIPEDWKLNNVGSLFQNRVDKVSDFDFKPLSVTKNGIFPQLENVAKSNNHSDRKKVCAGDFVINSRSDRKMSSGISPLDGSVSLINTVLYGDEIIPDFTKYLLKNYGFAEEFYRWGTGIVADLWSTNFERMKRITVPYPSREEQYKIASFLDEKVSQIDSILEDTKKSIEEFQSYKKAMITETVTHGLNRDCKMKESGIDLIGVVPSNWHIIKIKYLLSERSVKSQTGLEEPLSMSQRYGLIPTKDMEYIPNMSSSNIGNKTVNVDDLVFNKLKAHLGVFATSKYNGIVSPDYAVYFSKGKTNVKFLEYLFKTPQYINEFKKYSRGVGAGLTRLYTNELFNIKCAVPDLKEQTTIVNYINYKILEIDDLIEQKQQLLTEFEAYKKSLIYEYITGKKEVL